MPSVRSVILLAVLIFGMSIVLGTLSMLRTPDSGGRGADSYGTRAAGYRALFETLDELGVPVDRRLPPPSAAISPQQTLVFLAPHENLVGVEPAYLEELQGWIRRGGRVVVAPTVASKHDASGRFNDRHEGEEPTRDILDVLGLADISAVPVATKQAEESTPWAGTREFPARSQDSPRRPGGVFGQWSGWTGEPAPIHSVAVEATGSLERLRGLVDTLAIPGDSVQTVDLGETEPAGTIMYRGPDDAVHHLVAHFERGAGQVIVVGDAHLLTNRFLAEADNSILAVHLVAPAGQNVVFDEFYHGLAVRGNPLYLLTRPGYAAVVVGLLLAIAAWTWREAILLGPPLPDVESRRRDIGEYVDAMARLFHRSRKSRPFLLREVRDGALNLLCQEVGLPPETHSKEAVIAAIARRDPARAQRLEQVLAEVDGQLEHPRHWSDTQTQHAMQGILACL